MPKNNFYYSLLVWLICLHFIYAKPVFNFGNLFPKSSSSLESLDSSSTQVPRSVSTDSLISLGSNQAHLAQQDLATAQQISPPQVSSPFSQNYVSDSTVSILKRYTMIASKLSVSNLTKGAAYCAHRYNPLDHAHRQASILTKFSNSSTGVAGFFAMDSYSKEIILVFRGSANFENWQLNLQLGKSRFSFSQLGDLHHGFQAGYSSVRAAVIATMVGLVAKYPRYNIAFVGHSMGGAIATLAIADAFSIANGHRGYLDYQFFPGFRQNRATLVTVGSPRIGDMDLMRAFSKAQFKAVYRLVNNRDIVPHLPPKMLGYTHIPQEYFINHEGRVVTCDDGLTGEDTNCANVYEGLRLIEWNILEHMEYFGIKFNDASCSCLRDCAQ